MLPDNVAMFKSDIEACFKTFSKIRGKNRESAEMLKYFHELFEEHIEGKEPSSSAASTSASAAATEDTSHSVIGKKRSRPSDASVDLDGSPGTGTTSEDPARKKPGRPRKLSDASEMNFSKLTDIQKVSPMKSFFFFIWLMP
jgi:hypothetical protein